MASNHVPSSVLITGATGDFGKAFAAKFAAIGSKLFLHGRDKNKVDALVAQYPGSVGIVFDITDTDAMRKALNTLPAIDLLINNAGLALGLDKAYEANPDDWETMIDVDCKALTLVTREILPGMKERGRGHIINIGSTAGTYPYAGGNVYGAAKAFVKQFSLNLRADLTGTNIRVSNIEPGQVETQFWPSGSRAMKPGPRAFMPGPVRCRPMMWPKPCSGPPPCPPM